MKIIAIGDVHGRDCWKQVVATEQFDKLVFIGDFSLATTISITCPDRYKPANHTRAIRAATLFRSAS